MKQINVGKLNKLGYVCACITDEIGYTSGHASELREYLMIDNKTIENQIIYKDKIGHAIITNTTFRNCTFFCVGIFLDTIFENCTFENCRFIIVWCTIRLFKMLHSSIATCLIVLYFLLMPEYQAFGELVVKQHTDDSKDTKKCFCKFMMRSFCSSIFF